MTKVCGPAVLAVPSQPLRQGMVIVFRVARMHRFIQHQPTFVRAQTNVPHRRGFGNKVSGSRAVAACLSVVLACLAATSENLFGQQPETRVSRLLPTEVRPSPQLDALLNTPTSASPNSAPGSSSAISATTSTYQVPVSNTAILAASSSSAWNIASTGQPSAAWDPDSRQEESSLVSTPVIQLPQSQARASDVLDQQLPGPSHSAPSGAATRDWSPGLTSGARSLFQTGVALVMVLILLFACVWFLKKAAPRSLQPLPVETVQVLGNAPLYGKQHLRLIRLGQRLLLLSVSETTTQTLAEISDPAEVQQLLELCQTKRADSVSQTFESLLREGSRERTSGFLGSQQDQLADRTGRRPAIVRASESAGESPTSTSPSRATVRPASNHFFEA